MTATLERRIMDNFNPDSARMVPYTKLPIFQMSIEVDPKERSFIYPVAMGRDLANLVISDTTPEEERPNKIFFCRFVKVDTQVCRTFQSFMGIVQDVGASWLCQVDTSKGERYWVHKGLILDKDFNPLVIFANSRKKLPDDNTWCVESTRVLLVDSSVMSRDDMVSKNFRRTVIPYVGNCCNFEVIIKPLSEYRVNSKDLDPAVIKSSVVSLADLIADSFEGV